MASKNSTAPPACNRLLQKKWEEKSLQQHKMRVSQQEKSLHQSEDFLIAETSSHDSGY